MLTKEQVDELVQKVGTEATTKITTQIADAEKRLEEKQKDAAKGLMAAADFEKFKTEEMAKINEKLAELSKMEDAVRDQGTKLTEIEKGGSKAAKSFEDFIIEKAPLLKELRQNGKYVEYTAKELKAAGIQTVSGSVTDMTTPPGSPYLPGIGGADLNIFDILRNPNFILGKVDLGRTNQSRLAWINETDYQGAPAEITEGQVKPFVQHKFQVEMSIAKKIAAVLQITEEFEDDLPQLATRVRRMLEADVMRGWDDAIQAAVIAIAPLFTGGAGLNAAITTSNYWDAILSMIAFIQVNNFPDVNTTALYPFTSVAMQTDKSAYGYWDPPFKERILNTLVEANKLAPWFALVGDLKQYKVDIYKDFVLKMGWINDDFVRNQFCIVGEIRYHRYISDARKKAIVYDDIRKVRTIVGSQVSP